MQALACKDLVYIPLAKQASSSHTNFFKERLGWQPMQSDQIDWSSQHVFAHMRDPYRKHRQGLIEAIMQHKLQDILDDRLNLLLLCSLFDHHSYPISYVFGIKMMYIDWVLLDHADVAANSCTAKLLQDHGIDIDPGDIPMDNQITVDKLALESRLEQFFREHQDRAGILTYFYDEDLYWYRQVYQYTRFCEIDNLAWAECSWLRNFPPEQKKLQIKNFATLFEKDSHERF